MAVLRGHACEQLLFKTDVEVGLHRTQWYMSVVDFYFNLSGKAIKVKFVCWLLVPAANHEEMTPALIDYDNWLVFVVVTNLSVEVKRDASGVYSVQNWSFLWKKVLTYPQLKNKNWEKMYFSAGKILRTTYVLKTTIAEHG